MVSSFLGVDARDATASVGQERGNVSEGLKAALSADAGGA